MSWEKDMDSLSEIFAEDHAKQLGIERKYADWIVENVDDTGYGQCKEVTQEMAKEFPELTRVRGHYYCWAWGERAHWWLVDPTGVIIDPTAQQFPSRGRGEYVPWIEGAPEPSGMCPNCGDPCYDGMTCCSEKCFNEYVAYCNNPN
jgi:hypothetical protein